jgi:hypothetical protein
MSPVLKKPVTDTHQQRIDSFLQSHTNIESVQQMQIERNDTSNQHLPLQSRKKKINDDDDDDDKPMAHALNTAAQTTSQQVIEIGSESDETFAVILQPPKTESHNASVVNQEINSRLSSTAASKPTLQPKSCRSKRKRNTHRRLEKNQKKRVSVTVTTFFLVILNHVFSPQSV